MKRFALILCLLLIPSQSWAAISANTLWHVRPSGSSTNGGGYIVGSGTTDYSQQDAAQVAVTDGVANGTTTITSATANFTAAMVGNTIYISGGTGSISANRYQIATRVSATEITVDRSTGLTTGTGVTLNVGGALDVLATAESAMVADNDISIYSGSYAALGSTVTFDVAATGAGGGSRVYGEGPSQPVITSSTNSVALLTLNNADYYTIENIKFTHTAGTRGHAITGTTSLSAPLLITGNTFDGVLSALNVNSNGPGSVKFVGNDVRNTTSTTGAVNIGTGTDVELCHNLFADNTASNSAAIYGDNVFNVRIHHNRFANNEYGIRSTSSSQNVTCRIVNNSFYDHGDDAIEIAATSGTCWVGIDDNVIYDATSEGVDFNEATDYFVYSFANNAFGACGANYSGIVSTSTEADITMSVSPFVDGANEDLELNGTVDGGIECQDVGFGGFDLGALQAAEDYPDESDVIDSVDYFFGLLTGSASITAAPYRSVERGGNLVKDAARNISIRMLDSDDHVSGKTGLTLTINASKNGAAFASISPTVTERTNGWYQIALTGGHTDTAGDLVLRITATGADPLEIIYEVEPGITISGGMAEANIKAVDDTEVDGLLDTNVVNLENNVITSSAIQSGAITATGIAADAIGASEVAADAIGASELAANAIGAAEIADAAIDAGALETNAITAASIAADAIGASEVATDAIGANEIAASAIGASEVATGAIDADAIATDAAEEIGAEAGVPDVLLDQVEDIFNLLDDAPSLSDELDAQGYTQQLAADLSDGATSNILLSTTIASGSGTSYVLTNGSSVSDTYNGQTFVVYDDSNGDFPSVGVVEDYVGPTKTITLEDAPLFSVAASDPVKIYVGSSFGSGGGGETDLSPVQEVVDAIKLKTDNLPSDPADQSILVAEHDASQVTLGTINTNAATAATESATAATQSSGANTKAADIQSRLPATLDTGLMRSNATVGEEAAEVIADALVEAGVGGSPTSPAFTAKDHIWKFDNRRQLQSPNRITEENETFDATCDMDFSEVLDDEVAIFSVTSVTISPTAGTEPTLGVATISRNRKRVVIPIDTKPASTACDTGTYTVTATILSTDNQTYTRKGLLVIQ